MPQPERISGAKFSRRNQCVLSKQKNMAAQRQQCRSAAHISHVMQQQTNNVKKQTEQTLIWNLSRESVCSVDSLLLQVKSPSAYFLLQTPSESSELAVKQAFIRA